MYLKPKLITCMKNYSFSQFTKDVVSGIIVAIIALIALEVFDVNPAVVIIAAAIYGLFVFRFLFRDKGGAK